MRSRVLQNLTRRELIRTGFIAGGALTAASAFDIPSVLEKVAYAAGMENVKNNQTVGMIQLAGGQDGLNTVIPLTDKLESVRPGFGNTVIQDALNAGTRLNADFALHPSMKNMARRFRQGHVAILMDLGYPMNSRSHFEATQIWQTGDPTNRQLSGAFGRLAPFIDAAGHPLGLSSLGSQTVPGILRGTGQVAVLPSNPATYGFKGGVEQALTTLWKAGVPGIYGQALTSYMDVARNTTAELRTLVAQYKPQGLYDMVDNNLVFQAKNDLARNLQVAAVLIKGGAAPTVFHTTEGGWDTHQNEQTRQTDLLRLVDEAVDAFLTDCAAAGQFPTIGFWSEFGRTIGVNSTGGCDHGNASPMLVVGQNVVGGIYGNKPDLSGYDVPMQSDFRSMYATLINSLGVDPKVIVGNYPLIPFMSSTPAPSVPVAGQSPPAVSPPATVTSPAASTPTPSPRPPSSPTPSPKPSPAVSPSPSATPSPGH